MYNKIIKGLMASVIATTAWGTSLQADEGFFEGLIYESGSPEEIESSLEDPHAYDDWKRRSEMDAHIEKLGSPETTDKEILKEESKWNNRLRLMEKQLRAVQENPANEIPRGETGRFPAGNAPYVSGNARDLQEKIAIAKSYQQRIKEIKEDRGL